MFYSDEMRNLLVTETNRYANQHNLQLAAITEDEMNKFAGILLFSGYNTLPNQRLYWNTDEDVSSNIVRKTMPRNRFMDIKRSLHMTNNDNLNSDDKVAKVRPLYDLLNKSLMQFKIFHRDLSCDEQMIPYFGKHSAKMYMRSKPVKFGYKLWVICSSNEFPYFLTIYTGRTDNSRGGVPLGTESSIPFRISSKFRIITL